MSDYRWKLALKYDPGQPRVPAGSSEGGQWTSRVYRGMHIDVDLENDYLDRLNSIVGIDVTSTCSGHPEGTATQQSGGNEYPGFVFNINLTKDFERVFELFQKIDDAKINVSVWAGPFGNWVVWSNGKWRYDVFADRVSPEELRQSKIDSISVEVESTIRATYGNKIKRDAWWRKAVEQTEHIANKLRS